jgi:transposase
MYHTTGFTTDEITDLVAIVHRHVAESGTGHSWPPSLGLRRCVCVTLAYLRRNRVQCELAEAFGTSQPTISRAVTALTPLIGAALDEWIPVADEIDPGACFVLDGTLLPCWSWADHPELFSGKHKTTGLNVQVLCDLNGNPVWISDPVDGRDHDMTALAESGLLDGLDPANLLADKGYQGSDMITPIKKPQGGELRESDKMFNTQVNQLRSVVERAIANLKTWRILHTDYRRPLATFRETITATIGPHFYRLA